MNTNSALDFVASMNGLSTENYVERWTQVLENLPTLKELAEKLTVNSVEEYQQGMKLFDLLNGLTCYVWNSNLKENEKAVSEVYSIAWKTLYAFCKQHNRLSGDAAKLGRYIVWNKHYYHGENSATIILETLKKNIFKKNGSYYLTGFHLATGDNTFTVSHRTGQQYRNYVKTLGLQALPVSGYWADWINHFVESNNMVVEDLPEYYETTSIGDYKYAVKISCSLDDRILVSEILRKG